MHAPCHVMFKPMERVLAHLLGLLVTILGRDLLPCLVLLLPGLVASVLFVPRLLIIVEGVFEILVSLKMPFEGIDLNGHGNNLLVVRRFGAPLPLLPEPIILAQSRGHEGFVSEIDELAVKVVVVVVPDVHLEVVAGEDLIGFKMEPNRVVKTGIPGKHLRIILVELAIDLVDIAIDCGCKYPEVVEVIAQDLRGCNRVDGGKPHDDLVHQRCILHAIEGVIIVVGE